jgi:hypothetical protein
LGVACCSATLCACRGDIHEVPGNDEAQVFSVSDLQYPHAVDQEPLIGRDVLLRSVVVTAVDRYAEARQDVVTEDGQSRCVDNTGYAGGIAVQDPEGGAWGGVVLFNPTVTSQGDRLVPGTLVDVRGRYVEFCYENGEANNACPAHETQRLTQLTEATVAKVGEVAAPEAVEVSAAELANDHQAEAFEGVLVRLEGPLQVTPCRGEDNCCVGDYNRYGSLKTDVLEITSEFYSIPTGTRCLGAVTGIVTWFNKYRLAPRGPEDVEIPEQCLPGA